MKKLSIDIGASTLDVVAWKDDKDYEVLGSFEYAGQFNPDLKSFLGQKGISLDDFSNISVTGGNSSKIRGVEIVNEIEAIGRGGQYLAQELRDNFVVASLGTGTCFVHVDEGGFKHLGGTGVGGGTLLGLSRELFGVTNLEEIKKLYEKGDREHVDLSVEEIIGHGIGIVSGAVTASNLGKLAREVEFTKEDLAAGVVNLIGQTIATAACFAAKSIHSKSLVLTGKLTRIDMVIDVIRRVAEVYEIKVFLPKDGEYVSAIGAGAL